MISQHVHDALSQVRALQVGLLARQPFRGYSARARALSSLIALSGGLILSRPEFPATHASHLVIWFAVGVLALVVNFGDLFYWYLSLPDEERDVRRLRPVADGLPPLAAGVVFTLALLANGQYNLLFGAWMTLFGLMNLSSTYVLPKAIWPLGIYYLLCGSICLLHPAVSFLNPWPMAAVFFFGEIAGAYVFQENRGKFLSPRKMAEKAESDV